MSKRGVCFVLLGFVLIGVFFVLSRPAAYSAGYCAFCDSVVVDRQKFYEDEYVLALYTHKPIFPGHCLILPKRHVERFELLTEEEITHMGRVIKKVDRVVRKVFDTSAYLLLQKNGLEVGQSVPHVHVHYIPRKAGENSTFGFLLKMYIANSKRPISAEAMMPVIDKLQQEMHLEDF